MLGSEGGVGVRPYIHINTAKISKRKRTESSIMVKLGFHFDNFILKQIRFASILKLLILGTN
jgi:hypothetical protein